MTRRRRVAGGRSVLTTCIRQHTSACVCIRQHTRRRRVAGGPSALTTCIRYVSLRQHVSAYVSIRGGGELRVDLLPWPPAYVSIRQHTSFYHQELRVDLLPWPPAYGSIRQHVCAYVSIRGGGEFRVDFLSTLISCVEVCVCVCVCARARTRATAAENR